MISAPSEMRCMSMSAISMIGKTIASVSGIESAMTRPGRTPRLMKLTTRMMATACQSDVMNSAMALVDGDGLVGDELRLDAERQVGGEPRHRLLDVRAERQDVAAVAHRDRKADGRFAIDAEHAAAADRHSRAVTVAMSLRRSMRPPTAKLMFAQSCSELNAPETRSERLSSPV